MFQVELDDESPYQVSIGAMRLRLLELQKSDNKAQKVKAEELKDNYKDIDVVLYHQRLLFVLKSIQTKLISRHHDDFLVKHFGINKIKDLVG